MKPILAGGDKVRGDNGQGSVVQVCVTPFEGETDCMWEDNQ